VRFSGEVTSTENYLKQDPRDLRSEVEELYSAYSACLDEERFEEWPAFFVEQCLYKIIPRDNFERGLPLATWLCESSPTASSQYAGRQSTAPDMCVAW
jgi:hypothetical protein